MGGGDGRIEKPYETAVTLLYHMNCYNIQEVVFSHNTNDRPAVKDEKAIEGVMQIIDFFYGGYIKEYMKFK